jgi:uncharacterized membrane protein YdjX (TVP38/TMEM64 family)
MARHARPLLIALVCFAVGAVLLSQGLDASSPARDLLRTLLVEVRDPRWGILYVLLAYALGTMVFAPITAMFVATCLAVGSLRGVAYSLIGGLFSASLAYAAGRRFGARWVGQLNHRSLDKLRSLMATRPVRAVLLSRFLPVGNFTVINLALGGFRVRYTAFLIGNVLGMAPGLLAITMFEELLEQALHHPDWKRWALLALGGAAAVAMLYAVSRRLGQRRLLASEEGDFGEEDESDDDDNDEI